MIDCLEFEGRVKCIISEQGSGASLQWELEAGNYGQPSWEGGDFKKGVYGVQEEGRLFRVSCELDVGV